MTNTTVFTQKNNFIDRIWLIENIVQSKSFIIYIMIFSLIKLKQTIFTYI